MADNTSTDAIVNIGTIATAIDLAASIIDDLVGNGITPNVKVGNIEANLATSESIQVVATRMGNHLTTKHGLANQAT